MEGEKKFLDTVHGYISVPAEYCDNLIDTRHFQRLRRIEQSSARSLYPCARHDRFIHSLGVFHIGVTEIISVPYESRRTSTLCIVEHSRLYSVLTKREYRIT